MTTLLAFTVLAHQVPLTWYGGTFIGAIHSAGWHGETPRGCPGVVSENFPGIAAPDDVPFGARVLVCAGDRCVMAVVLDRTGRGDGWDAWPALAEQLGFGPTLGDKDPGVVTVNVYVVTDLDYGAPRQSGYRATMGVLCCPCEIRNKGGQNENSGV